MSKNLFIFSRFTRSYSLSIFKLFFWLSPKNASANESMQFFSLLLFFVFDCAESLRFWMCSGIDAICFVMRCLYSCKKFSFTYSIFL